MDNKFKKLAILDFDGTLIKGQSQKLLINFFYKKGYLNLFRYIVLSFWFILFKLNIFKNLKPIVEFATNCIKGKRISELEPFFDDFFNSKCIPLIYNDSKNLIDFLKNNDFHVIIVSTAVDAIVSRAQHYLCVDEIISTKLEVINDVYTGKIIDKPVFGERKSIMVEEFIDIENFDHNNISVFADHNSDIPLLSLAKNPVAVNPSSKLWKYAHLKNWPVLYLNDNESFQYFKSHTVF